VIPLLPPERRKRWTRILGPTLVTLAFLNTVLLAFTDVPVLAVIFTAALATANGVIGGWLILEARANAQGWSVEAALKDQAREGLR
jgi:hypothetical protein